MASSSKIIQALTSSGVPVLEGIDQRWHRDYSIFALEPSAVVRPLTEDHIQKTILAAREEGIPVVARGGGSNTGGAAISDGVILAADQTAMSGISFDSGTGLVTARAGTRHDVLQRELQAQGMWLPSDPSSGPLSCIGGNVATRASGPHALRHGAIHRYVQDVQFVMADGHCVDTRDPSTVPSWLVRGLEAQARALCSDHELLSEVDQRRNEKWATGYELLALADHAADPVRAIPRLMTGSMGTLGVITEATFVTQRAPTSIATAVLSFTSPAQACRAAQTLAKTASAVEILSPAALRFLDNSTATTGQTQLICEWSGAGAIAELARDSAHEVVHSATIESDRERIADLWKTRKAILHRIRQRATGDHRAYSVINDIGTHPSRLADLIEDLDRMFDRRGLAAPMYGHAGNGNLHLRPLFPQGDVATVWETACEVYDLVASYDGCISPEHGLGRVRAPFLSRDWSARAITAMKALKDLFDPDDVLNPGVIFHPGTFAGASAHQWIIDPFLE